MIIDKYFLFVSCVMGLVEGLTEFLPISSTLHMVFVASLLGLNDDNEMVLLLSVFFQLGAIMSIVVVFWNHFFMSIKKIIYYRDFVCFNRSCLGWGHIILGILPTVILGFFFMRILRICSI